MRWDEAPLCYSKHNEVGRKVPLWNPPPICKYMSISLFTLRLIMSFEAPQTNCISFGSTPNFVLDQNCQFSLNFHLKRCPTWSNNFRMSHLWRKAINQTLGQPSLLLMSNLTSRCYNHRAAASNWADNNYSGEGRHKLFSTTMYH